MALANFNYTDFVFDDDFVVNDIGELALTGEVDFQTRFPTYTFAQVLDSTLSVKEGDLQFHSNYGARLDRLFGFAISQSLIEFGRTEISKAIESLFPNENYSVEGYYLKSFNDTIIFDIKFPGSDSIALLVNTKGIIDLRPF